jgi:hypothetical protein
MRIIKVNKQKLCVSLIILLFFAHSFLCARNNPLYWFDGNCYILSTIHCFASSKLLNDYVIAKDTRVPYPPDSVPGKYVKVLRGMRTPGSNFTIGYDRQNLEALCAMFRTAEFDSNSFYVLRTLYAEFCKYDDGIRDFFEPHIFKDRSYRTGDYFLPRFLGFSFEAKSDEYTFETFIRDRLLSWQSRGVLLSERDRALAPIIVIALDFTTNEKKIHPQIPLGCDFGSLMSSRSREYNLIAIHVHNGGHYAAYVRSYDTSDKGKWYWYDEAFTSNQAVEKDESVITRFLAAGGAVDWYYPIFLWYEAKDFADEASAASGYHLATELHGLRHEEGESRVGVDQEALSVVSTLLKEASERAKKLVRILSSMRIDSVSHDAKRKRENALLHPEKRLRSDEV